MTTEEIIGYGIAFAYIGFMYAVGIYYYIKTKGVEE